jgi:hypothetical protein
MFIYFILSTSGSRWIKKGVCSCTFIWNKEKRKKKRKEKKEKEKENK